MNELQDAAVIFDVDGVLLDLTRDEEEVFFTALSRFVPTEHLSRDWNAYRIRNDDDIVTEILQRNDLPLTLKPAVITHYILLLEEALHTGLDPVAIAGAEDLLKIVPSFAKAGIATANFRAAAMLRLQKAGLWNHVASHAQGADGGGHKREILARALAGLMTPRERVVYIGDNVNDVEAGLGNNVHFIGFSTDAGRRAQLAAHGATHISANHVETMRLIHTLLA